MLSSWDYRNREKKYRNLNTLSPEVLRTTVLRDETATQGLCAAGRAAGRVALASCQTWVQHYRSTPPPDDGSADQWQLHTVEKKRKKKKSAKTNSIALSNKATLSIVIGWPTAEKFTNITPPHVHCKYCFPVCQSRVHQGKKKKKPNMSHHWVAIKILYNFSSMEKPPKGDRKIWNLQLEPKGANQSLSGEKYEHSETALFRTCRKYWQSQETSDQVQRAGHGKGMVGKKKKKKSKNY